MLRKTIRSRGYASISRLIYEKLYHNNVTDAFVYTGGAILPLVDQFHKNNNIHGINTYTSANEQCLTATAIGYARVSKKPGVVIVTSGPGILNAVTNIYDAMTDGIPLVVLSGQVSINSFGKSTFQEAPSEKIMKSIAKLSTCVYKPNPVDIARTIDTAFYMATKPRSGPVFIDLPKCILNTSIDDSIIASVPKRNIRSIFSGKPTRAFPCYPSDSMKRIFKQKYKRPLIIVGKGCADASDELRKFSKKHRIPVTCTLHGLGISDESDPLSLSMHGMHGLYHANMAIQNADLIVAFGSRFDDRSIGNPSKYAPHAKKIILINNDRQVTTGILPSLHVPDTCENALRRINNIVSTIYDRPESADEWLTQIDLWRKSNPLKSNYSNTSLTSDDVLRELNQQTRHIDNVIFTSGVGNHQMKAAQYIDFRRPGQLITSGSLGVMGNSTSYAIGALIANPKAMVISIDGDQCFNMSLNDLKTAMTYNLPLKIIIMNNSALGMVMSWERVFCNGRHTTTRMSNPNFCKIADSYGFRSILCTDRRNIKSCIHNFLNYPGPVLLNAITDFTMCYPFVLPGKPLSDSLNNQ